MNAGRLSEYGLKRWYGLAVVQSPRLQALSPLPPFAIYPNEKRRQWRGRAQRGTSSVIRRQIVKIISARRSGNSVILLSGWTAVFTTLSINLSCRSVDSSHSTKDQFKPVQGLRQRVKPTGGSQMSQYEMHWSLRLPMLKLLKRKNLTLLPVYVVVWKFVRVC